MAYGLLPFLLVLYLSTLNAAFFLDFFFLGTTQRINLLLDIVQYKLHIHTAQYKQNAIQYIEIAILR